MKNTIFHNFLNTAQYPKQYVRIAKNTNNIQLSKEMAACSSHLCRAPTIQFQFIFVSSIYQGSILSSCRRIYQGSILSSAHLFRNRCGAVPFPARRWFNQFPCSALDYQLLGDASRRHLYSTQVYSTQLAFPLEKRRRTEEKVTLLAKLIDLTSICSINTT